jgi:ATPase subunit of ABC transporter with duplicated ATPase domains
MTAAIVCSDISFSWPDGAPVLSGLTVSFGLGRTGLIGVNGSGKSTLLRLIAGELRPGSGAIRARGEVGYLPQAITLGTRRSVSDLLGITAARDALHAIEAGETGEAAFAAVGDDWDVEERARAWLDRLGLGRLGLGGVGLDDRVERLSGGETILVALAALLLRRPNIMLLDGHHAARRADQQPGPGVGPAAVCGARGLPRRDPGGQPRRAVPAFGRDHPLAPPGLRSRPDRDRPAISLTVIHPL